MPKVYGDLIDNQTRCRHYHKKEDVIAIKFKCCQRHYPCYKCHQAYADHPIERWSKSEFNQLAILCGVCKKELTINEYVNKTRCPNCTAVFNPGCSNHYHLYFDKIKER